MLTRNGPPVAGNRPSVLVSGVQPTSGEAAPPGDVLVRCHHATPSLTCALSGSFRLSLAGTPRTISPGAAVWIAAGVPHELFSADTARCFTIAIPDQRPAPAEAPLCIFRMTPLLREVVVRLATPAEFAETERTAHLEAVLCDELGALAAARVDARLPEHPAVRALCRAFLDDPSSNVSADEWAARFGLTGKTLARRFRAECHTTFGAWQRAVRVAEARSRLAAGQSVTQVAGDLGYESLSAFAAMFRRSTGVTPSSVAAAGTNFVRGDPST